MLNPFRSLLNALSRATSALDTFAAHIEQVNAGLPGELNPPAGATMPIAELEHSATNGHKTRAGKPTSAARS